MPHDTLTPGAVERLVRRDRTIVATGLVILCALAWLWVIRGAGMGMTAAEMTRTGFFPHLGSGMEGGMTMVPSGGAWADLLLMTSMWWVMMTAMMLPSAAPMILLHAGTVRHAHRRGRMSAPPATAAFLGGYLVVWLGFSVLAVLLQSSLVAVGTVSDMMLWSNSRWLSASILLLAALYQLSPVKRVCLEHCRSPAHYLSRHWRPGAGGAFRMGLEHGSYCVGCCWVLMLLLFVGGVMNLIWIAALAVFVLIEKLGVVGTRGGLLSAALLGLWALATVVVT